MLHLINSRTPFLPSSITEGAAGTVDELILRMLAKEARLRPSALEVDQALSQISGASGSNSVRRPAGRTSIVRHTVGREQERNELRAAFMAACSGHGSLLCVAGEPGIGKTTLVEDLLGELGAEQRCTIARGRCSERLAGTEAYLPLLEALESLLRDGHISEMEPAMRQIAPTWYAQVAPQSGEEIALLISVVSDS
jgi:AAA ATPase-like protein